MKSTIYSQKHIADHGYMSGYANGNYYQGMGMQTKKSSTLKKLEQSILTNAVLTHKSSKQIPYFPFTNEHYCHGNMPAIPSPIMVKAKKPTQKPVQSNADQIIGEHFIREYQKIINNLEHYYKYYEWKMNGEIQRHNQYFSQIVKVVENQKKKSESKLKDLVKALFQKIQLQVGALQTKISMLQNANIKPYDKEVEELKTQQALEIPLFEVRFPKIDAFKQDIKKFLFQFVTEQEFEKQLNSARRCTEQNEKQLSPQRSLDKTIFLEESIKKQNKEKVSQSDLAFLQIQQMTPIHCQSEENVLAIKSPSSLEDQDLYCDEDIQNILKENKMSRNKKRYVCREEPIPEESESHEDSGILVNVDPCS